MDSTGILEKFICAGIAVRDIDDALRTLESLFGLKASLVRSMDNGTKIAMVDVGGFSLELIAPEVPNETVINRFLEKRGEGLFRLSFEVSDLRAALDSLKEKGVTSYEAEAPRDDGGMDKVAFLHPKAIHGVMMELLQAVPALARA